MASTLGNSRANANKISFLYKEFRSMGSSSLSSSLNGKALCLTYWNCAQTDFDTYKATLLSSTYGYKELSESGSPFGALIVNLDSSTGLEAEFYLTNGALEVAYFPSYPSSTSWPSASIASFFNLASDPFVSMAGATLYAPSLDGSKLLLMLSGITSDPLPAYVQKLTDAGWGQRRSHRFLCHAGNLLYQWHL